MRYILAALIALAATSAHAQSTGFYTYTPNPVTGGGTGTWYQTSPVQPFSLEPSVSYGQAREQSLRTELMEQQLLQMQQQRRW